LVARQFTEHLTIAGGKGKGSVITQHNSTIPPELQAATKVAAWRMSRVQLFGVAARERERRNPT